MTIDVDAVYEDGVLKPERPLALKEKAKVHVTIEARPAAATGAVDTDDPTGWKAIDALRGIVKGAPPDMAENHGVIFLDTGFLFAHVSENDKTSVKSGAGVGRL